MSKPNLFYCAALALLWAQSAAARCYCPYGGVLHEGAQTCMIPDGRGSLAPVVPAVCTTDIPQAPPPRDHLSQQCTPR